MRLGIGETEDFMRALASIVAMVVVGTGIGAVHVAGSRVSDAAAKPTAPITAVTLIHGIPGQEEELKSHLLSLTEPTLAEEGCLRYDLYQSPEQKHEFMRYEVWASAEALEAHKKTPHLLASFERRQREGWTTQILLWQPVRGM
jgi:quinol monooxygenase YgiN